MITSFKEIEQFFEELEKCTDDKINFYIIGGAALLNRGMKPSTKDIDVIVKTRSEFLNTQNNLIRIGFKTTKPGLEYSRMNLSQIFQRGDFRIDLFEKEVCKRFALSENMILRAEKILVLKK